MVAQFLRLRLTLLGNLFRGRPARVAWLVVGVLAALAGATAIAVGLVALRGETPEIARAIVVVFGTIVVLAFLLLPLRFGVDDTIDPRRFSLFGISSGALAFGLAVAAFVSVPTLVVAILSVAQVVTWSGNPLSTLFALAGAVLIVPTCVLAARVSSAVAASFLSSRRSRDASGVALTLVLAIVAPVVAFLATVDWQSQGLPIMRRVASVVSWTPFGAVWSAPGDAALGSPDLALAKLAIGVAFLAVLWFAWRGLVALMLVRPRREVTARTYSGLGWFARLPATPLGAVAARSLSYWGRDSRYQVALSVIPLVPVVMVAALLVGGIPVDVITWIPVPVMCLFLGWTVHNDVAHDSSAFWIHVSANTRGADDRWGRVIPPLFIGVPLVLIGSVVTVIIVGDWTKLPGLIGLSACVLLAGLGISSLISAAFPYPAVHPGDSPFAQPQAVGAGGSVVQAVSLVATIVFAAPVLGAILLYPQLPYAALGIGVATGIVVLVGGVYWGGFILGRRAPELLAFTLQN